MTSAAKALRIRKEYNLTDLGNAERFIEQHGKDLRYVPAWRKWLVWDCGWNVDETRIINRLASETARSVWREIPDAETVGERADVANHARRSESERAVRAMVSLAENDKTIVVRPSELDRDPWLLQCENGVLDLRTTEFRPARREDLLTKVASVAYDPTATAPMWDGFLQRALPSEELRGYVQRAVGYTLTALTVAQVFFLLYGKGANGKTVFTSVLRSLLGGYGAAADFNSLLERRNESPRTDIARLQGRRCVTANEVGEGRRLDEGLIKQLTGGDAIVARQLYQAEEEFTPAFKLWLSANHKPTIRGTDYAVWRRVHLIPFIVTIPEDERDPHLTEAIRKQLPGILNWALEGCTLWQTYGLQPPSEVLTATEEYRVESDILGAFILEMCEVDSAVHAPAANLYRAFDEWTKAAGEPRMSKTAFGRKLGERGFAAEKKGTVRRVGIRLRPQEPSETIHAGQNGQSRTVKGPFVNSSFASALEKVPETGLELSTVQDSLALREVTV